MIEIQIILVGKTKEKWLIEALSEYEKRLSSTCRIQWVCVKSDQQMLQHFDRSAYPIAMDPKGALWDSTKFVNVFSQAVERSGCRLQIFIGGADGLPSKIKEKATLWSLSPLTFTHQIARLVLLEQIYRACEILRGSPYHR